MKKLKKQNKKIPKKPQTRKNQGNIFPGSGGLGHGELSVAGAKEMEKLGQKRVGSMCDWVTLLYGRKLTEHRKPAIMEIIKII